MYNNELLLICCDYQVIKYIHILSRPKSAHLKLFSEAIDIDKYDIKKDEENLFPEAALKSTINVVNFMIERGADVSRIGTGTVTDLARLGKTGILKVLFDNGLESRDIAPSSLIFTALEQKVGALKLLLKHGVNAAPENQSVILSVRRPENINNPKYREIMKELISHGADIMKLNYNEASDLFGSPNSAVRKLNNKSPEKFIEACLKRQCHHSKKGITTLANEAPRWLQPYYIKLMSI